MNVHVCGSAPLIFLGLVRWLEEQLILSPRKTLSIAFWTLSERYQSLPRAGHKAAHSCDATGRAPRTRQVAEHIGSLALRKGGGAVVALGDGFCTLNFTDMSTISSIQIRASRASI